MSDTVQIAIITFLSGAVGAICGVIGAHISSKTSANAEMQKESLNLYLTARLNAYNKVCDEISNFAEAQFNIDVEIKLSSTIYKAILVASPETAKALHNYHDCFLADAQRARDAKQQNVSFSWSNEYQASLNKVFDAMQNDLLSFKSPEIKI